LKRSLFALAIVLAPGFAKSQQTTATPAATTVITGVAVDSVRGGYLRGALVGVSGTALSATTDSLGRFKIDSVPAGSHYLEVMHPLLDSLSLKVRTPARELKAGEPTTFILAVPSPATIANAKCSADEKQRGNAVLLGIVTDADTDAPSAGASVTVEWTDYQMTSRTLAKLPQFRTATVKADGTYKICGIPEDLVAPVIAYRGADSTGTVTVSFDKKLGVASFRLPGQLAAQPAGAAPAAGAQAKAGESAPKGSARLTGKVVDPAGNPLANARVAVETDNVAAVTDNQGKFNLNGLRTGTRDLIVRRIGFASVDMPVDVSAVNVRNVTVTMSRYVAQLEAVRVSAVRNIGLQRVGFTERQKTGAGKFIGPEEINSRNPDRLVNVLESGGTALRMGTDAEGHRYVTGRHNGCVGYYVDGMRWSSTDPSDFQLSPDFFLSGAEIGAVEIYDELSAPAEFSRISIKGEPCAVVVIWTKHKLGN
jgi:hypothetical protein